MGEVTEAAAGGGGGEEKKIKVGVCVMEKKVKCGSEVLFLFSFRNQKPEAMKIFINIIQ
jgi:hypothetical protein